MTKKKPAAKKIAKKKAPAKRTPPKSKELGRKPLPEIEGLRPLCALDFQYCQAYCETGSQVEAYRRIWPEAKSPHTLANRIMQRPEIREHIQDIFKLIAKERTRAAEVSARALTLSITMADDRLVELLQSRRRTKGEMLAKDLRSDKHLGTETSEFEESLSGPAPIEDGDLIQVAKVAYSRLGANVKSEASPVPTQVQVMLYRPEWRQRAIAASTEVVDVEAV